MKPVQPSLATTSHHKYMPQNYQSVMCYLQSGLIVLAMIHSVGGDACKLVLYTYSLPSGCGTNLRSRRVPFTVCAALYLSCSNITFSLMVVDDI